MNRSASDGAGIFYRPSPRGGVDNHCEVAVDDGVNHVGPALSHLVDAGHLEAAGRQPLGRSTGRDDLEAKREEGAGEGLRSNLVGILHRQEDAAAERERIACRDLGLEEGAREAGVDAHDLARRAHLRTEDGVDAGNLRKGSTASFTEK